MKCLVRNTYLKKRNARDVLNFKNLFNKLNKYKRDVLRLTIPTVVCNPSKRGKYNETDGNVCSYSVKIFMRSHDNQKDVTKNSLLQMTSWVSQIRTICLHSFFSNDLFGFANKKDVFPQPNISYRYIFAKKTYAV
jgi:hypothetical protein